MASFESLYRHDFVRIAACVPRTRVGAVTANLEETIRLARRGNELNAALMVFPELGLSAYAIDDLLFQDALIAAVEQAIAWGVDYRSCMGRPCRNLRVRGSFGGNSALPARLHSGQRGCGHEPHQAGAHAVQHFRRLCPGRGRPRRFLPFDPVSPRCADRNSSAPARDRTLSLRSVRSCAAARGLLRGL